MKNLPLFILYNNKGDYLEECLLSFDYQTYKNWIVYLIDDYSDDTKTILNKYIKI